MPLDQPGRAALVAHTERGAPGVEPWLQDDAGHPHDHAGQARRGLTARRAGGPG